MKQLSLILIWTPLRVMSGAPDAKMEQKMDKVEQEVRITNRLVNLANISTSLFQEIELWFNYHSNCLSGEKISEYARLQFPTIAENPMLEFWWRISRCGFISEWLHDKEYLFKQNRHDSRDQHQKLVLVHSCLWYTLTQTAPVVTHGSLFNRNECLVSSMECHFDLSEFPSSEKLTNRGRHHQ